MNCVIAVVRMVSKAAMHYAICTQHAFNYAADFMQSDKAEHNSHLLQLHSREEEIFHSLCFLFF